MPRQARFEVPADTSFFTPWQAQPRILLAQTWSAFARWLHAHLVSFPEMIGKEKTGAVIMSISVRYVEDVKFFECPVLGVTAELSVLANGARLLLTTEFSAGERRIAQTKLLLCPVQIKDPISLAAEPAKMSPRLLERFRADEVVDAKFERVVPGQLERIRSSGKPLGEHEERFVVHRHLCEVADQWSFVEIPCLCESSHNHLALGRIDKSPELRPVLDGRMSQFDVELSKPFFSFDTGVLRSSAHLVEDDVYLVHELGSDAPGKPRHGTIVEVFPAARRHGDAVQALA